MILSEQKPFEEILGYLEGEKSVFLLGCNGCAQSSGSGGPGKHMGVITAREKYDRLSPIRLRTPIGNKSAWKVSGLLLDIPLMRGYIRTRPLISQQESMSAVKDCCGTMDENLSQDPDPHKSSRLQISPAVC